MSFKAPEMPEKPPTWRFWQPTNQPEKKELDYIVEIHAPLEDPHPVRTKVRKTAEGTTTVLVWAQYVGGAMLLGLILWTMLPALVVGALKLLPWLVLFAAPILVPVIIWERRNLK